MDSVVSLSSVLDLLAAKKSVKNVARIKSCLQRLLKHFDTDDFRSVFVTWEPVHDAIEAIATTPCAKENIGNSCLALLEVAPPPESFDLVALRKYCWNIHNMYLKTANESHPPIILAGTDVTYETLINTEKGLRATQALYGTFDHVILALHTLIPPRRIGEYVNMVTVLPQEVPLAGLNMFVAEPLALRMVSYKNSGMRGAFQLDLTNDSKYIEVSPELTVLGDILLTYAASRADKKALFTKALVAQVPRVMEKHVGVKLGNRDIRRMAYSYHSRMNKRNSYMQLVDEMLDHSGAVGRSCYLIADDDEASVDGDPPQDIEQRDSNAPDDTSVAALGESLSVLKAEMSAVTTKLAELTDLVVMAMGCTSY
jgi:hypothetical protein